MLGPFTVLVALATATEAASKLKTRQAPTGVPDYVLQYAPLVYLHSRESYFPTDLQTHLDNTNALTNFTPVANAPSPLTLNNLSQLGPDVYLTSKDDITTNPEWLNGTRPDSTGRTPNAKTAAVIVNDKGNGEVDVFYMYYYAYNFGGNVNLFGIPNLNFGNHVGDWEHTMLRFQNNTPTALWLSQHANGQAFKYPILTKSPTSPQRPLVYSALGTHANYATPGTHDHTIPNMNLPAGPLEDYTDAGPLWDPLLGAYFYRFNAADATFAPYGSEQDTPTDWLRFAGRWGDQEYPTSDKRQVKVFGFAKYVTGPTGPADKQLNRANVCPENGNMCILRNILVQRAE